MPKIKKEYNCLPGKKKGFATCSTLWMSEDHLLSVESVFFAENYKRFYYKDIQTVIIRKTREGKVRNAILGGTAGSFILVQIFLQHNIPFLSGVAVAGIFFLLLNCLSGPTCECYLRTAVQREKLQSLCRLRTARKFMSRLKPMIEKAQGSLSPEALADGDRIRQAEKISISALPAEPRVTKPGDKKAHHVLFYLLLVYGVTGLTDMFYNHVGITLWTTALAMSLLVCVIIALIRQYESATEAMLRGITWTTLGFLCADLLAGYIFYFITAFKNPNVMHNRWEMLLLISNLSPLENPILTGCYIFSICAALILGISGLSLVRR